MMLFKKNDWDIDINIVNISLDGVRFMNNINLKERLTQYIKSLAHFEFDDMKNSNE